MLKTEFERAVRNAAVFFGFGVDLRLDGDTYIMGIEDPGEADQVLLLDRTNIPASLRSIRLIYIGDSKRKNLPNAPKIIAFLNKILDDLRCSG